MGGLGAPELLIVLVVVLVLFGGAKLPQLARSLGQAQKEFRSGQDEERKQDDQPEPEPKPGGTAPPSPPPPSPPPA